MPPPTHLIEADYEKLFPYDIDEFPTPEDGHHYIDAWLLNSAFSSLAAIQGYLIGWSPNFTNPLGDSVTGQDGQLVIDIPQACYGPYKTATAFDSNLIGANIADGVSIFGVSGSHAPLTGDNVAGDNGALVISIPAGNYPAGKSATAADTNLTAANIVDGVSIFGVEGEYACPVPPSYEIFGDVTNADGHWTSSSFTSTQTYLQFGNAVTTPNNTYIRFCTLKIPKNAVIDKAILSLYASYSDSGVTANANIYFNDVTNPTTPTSTATANALALTAAIPWNSIPAWTAGARYDSPDLASILQTIVDRADWTGNNDVILVIKDNASSNAARRRPVSNDGTLARPVLTVLYH
jgi:hypothetical protein